MKLFFHKNLKDPTYYVQQTFRNGKKTTTHNVMNLGKRSELLKITDDPEGYVRKKIQEMNAEYRVGRSPITIITDFNERVKFIDPPTYSQNALNIGYFFLQDIMKGLCLKEFFKEKTSGRMISFNCFTVSRFLTYARILDPASKLELSKQLDSYYEKPDFDYQHILRFMDLLEENHNDYLAWLYRNSNSVVQRDTTVLYYDCTNFYFEINKADKEYVDEVTGETLPGLRQYGISKEHRPNPLVEMGLFMDSQGIPITMCIHPGNQNEQTTAIPLEEEVVKILGGAKFIYCADAGLGSRSIRQFNSMGGRSFVVTQSIRKLSRSLQKAVFEDNGYRLLSTDEEVRIEQLKEFDRSATNNRSLYDAIAYKMIPANKAVDLGLNEEIMIGNGSVEKVKATGSQKQWIIITFSRKSMEYQRATRNDQIERAETILKSADPGKEKKNANNVRRFIKKILVSKVKEAPVYEYVLDKERIAEEEKYDGFYAVATNLDDPVRDILAILHKKYQIEECFRLEKTSFSARPVFHRTPNRIKAHFLICYTALLVFRMLEAKLNQQGTHVTANDLIRTLRNMNVKNNHDVGYEALYDGNVVLKALTHLSPLILDRRHYRPRDLNKSIRDILR